jgi:hypothetical protein
MAFSGKNTKVFGEVRFNVRTTGKSINGFSNTSAPAPAPLQEPTDHSTFFGKNRFGKGLNSRATCTNGPACPHLLRGVCKYNHPPAEIKAAKTARLQDEIAEAQTALLQAQLDALKAQAKVLQEQVVACAQAESVVSKPSFRFNPKVADFQPTFAVAPASVEPASVYQCCQCDQPMRNVNGVFICEICDEFDENEFDEDEFDEDEFDEDEFDSNCMDEIEACLDEIEANVKIVEPVAPVAVAPVAVAPVARPGFKLVLKPRSQ